MKCPLMITNVPLAMSEDNPAVGDCIQANCAWWDREIGGCSILAAATALECIAVYLNTISRRIPHVSKTPR
jgi:hypothetical protein